MWVMQPTSREQGLICNLKTIALIFRISFEIIVIKFGTEVLKYLPTLAQLICGELTLGD